MYRRVLVINYLRGIEINLLQLLDLIMTWTGGPKVADRVSGKNKAAHQPVLSTKVTTSERS